MKKYIIGILAAVLLAASCDKSYDGYYDQKYYESSTDFLTLRNFSSDTTVWFIPERECAQNLPQELSEWQKISIYELNPHSSSILSFDSSDNYVTPVETYLTTDKIAVYVFKKSVWRTHTWKEMVDGQLWAGYCLLSVDELLDLNKIVTYPMR